MAAPHAPQLDLQGKKATDVSLEESVFAAEVKPHLVHEAVRSELNADRAGTAATKSRGLVSGGRAKPWRQKGTGRARVGALSSPSRFGGGVAFGPKPRHYTVKVNRKARRKALRSALSTHAERDSVALLDASAFDTPSTKAAAQALDKWGAQRSTLIVLAPEEGGAAKSFRNITRVQVAEVSAVGVADVIGAASLVVSEGALAKLQERLG